MFPTPPSESLASVHPSQMLCRTRYCPSICLSVCLSVTLRCYVKTAKHYRISFAARFLTVPHSDRVTLNMGLNPLTPTLLSYGYSYKASCARPD